jgi:hypothetical protein
VKSAHSNARDYPCTECEYRAKSSSHLKGYVKAVHLKIKDHACPECEYNASTSTHIKMHVRAVLRKENGSNGHD